jgi:hypothetical protein
MIRRVKSRSKREGWVGSNKEFEFRFIFTYIWALF